MLLAGRLTPRLGSRPSSGTTSREGHGVNQPAQAEVELPPVPRWKLDELLGVQADLYRLFLSCEGKVLLDHQLPGWAQQIAMAMKWLGPVEPIRDTLQQYLGKTIDKRVARVLSFTFAAREHELHRGPIPALGNPMVPEWVAVEILDVQETTWASKAGIVAGAEFTMLAMTGRCAGQILQRKFPVAWLGYLAYQVAFSRRIQYDYNPKHFLGLWFWGYVQPRDDDWQFIDIAVGPRTNRKGEDAKPGGPILKRNRTIVALRTRFEHGKVDCPEGFDHDCFDCTVDKMHCPATPKRCI